MKALLKCSALALALAASGLVHAQEAGKAAHPDAGGSEEAFAALRAAHQMLQSPGQRLKHWLEIHGHGVNVRGAISPGMMDWFTKVGEVSQRANDCLRSPAGTFLSLDPNRVAGSTTSPGFASVYL